MYVESYTIGKPNDKLKVNEMQLRSDYSEGVWELYILFPGMTAEEAANIQNGEISVAFAVINDLLFLFGKMGKIPWFDVPFEPARYAEPNTYCEFDTGSGAPVMVIGADSNTGIVRAIRFFSMSNSMSNSLHKVCRDMDVRHRPLDVTAQNAAIQRVYDAHPASEDMLKYVKPANITVISNG